MAMGIIRFIPGINLGIIPGSIIRIIFTRLTIMVIRGIIPADQNALRLFHNSLFLLTIGRVTFGLGSRETQQKNS